MRRTLLTLWLAFGLTTAAFSQTKLPPTPVREVTDEYFGTKITDPYRWLENTSDPEVVTWMKAQNEYTREVLAAIPGRQKFLDRVTELDKSSTRVRNAQLWGGKLFYLKTNPGQDNYKLYVSEAGKERLLLDTEPLTKDNVHYSIDYFNPSFDGDLVIYGISPGGSENSVLHVMETATGRVLPDAIDRTRFGIVSWLPGNKSFLYNRLQKLTPEMPRTAFEQRSKMYLHTLGSDPEKDPLVFGYGYSPQVKVDDNDISFAGYSLAAPKYLLAGLAHGTQNEVTLFSAPIADLKAAKISWKKVVDVGDGVVRFDIKGDDFYLVTHKNKPRYEVRKMSLKDPDMAHAQVVVPASERVIQEADVAQDAIYIRDLDGGVERVRKLTFAGTIEPVSLPEDESAGEISVTPNVPGALIHTFSWTNSPLWLKYDHASKTASDTKIQPPIPIDTSAFESIEVKAKSADGTMVPLSIIRRKGAALDGSHPTHLIGYGAYGISMDPYFDPVWVAWLERGGVLGIAHVRGGVSTVKNGIAPGTSSRSSTPSMTSLRRASTWSRTNTPRLRSYPVKVPAREES